MSLLGPTLTKSVTSSAKTHLLMTEPRFCDQEANLHMYTFSDFNSSSSIPMDWCYQSASSPFHLCFMLLTIPSCEMRSELKPLIVKGLFKNISNPFFSPPVGIRIVMDFHINLPWLWDTPANDLSPAAFWMCNLYEEFWSSDPQHQSHIPTST